MGKPFTRRIAIGRTEADGHEILRAVIDTGATYTWVPEDVLERLNIARRQRKPMILADGRSEYYDMGTCWIELDGLEGETPVVFGDVGSTPLVGCATLDDFSLGVDPVNERVVPVPARE